MKKSFQVSGIRSKQAVAEQFICITNNEGETIGYVPYSDITDIYHAESYEDAYMMANSWKMFYLLRDIMEDKETSLNTDIGLEVSELVHKMRKWIYKEEL